MKNLDWANTVLKFWYQELTPKQWFNGGSDLDRTIKNRFGENLKSLENTLPNSTRTDPRAALAAVIVLDQFSRNIYRSRKEAFSNDPKAVTLARETIESSIHLELNQDEQYFLFMPFMHSEDLTDQEMSLTLFDELGNKNAYKYAVDHHDIIKQFGRFPHRNKILGRPNTEAEELFLKDAKTYGQ